MASSSQFLSLPQELRDQIYKYVSLDSGAYLLPSQHGKPTGASSLLLVSRDVSEDYRNVLFSTAPIVTAQVKDFDFTHVVQFLDELSARESSQHSGDDALPHRPPRLHRQLDLILSLSRDCKNTLNRLDDWLQRICPQPANRYCIDFSTTYTPRDLSADLTTSVAPITLMQIIDTLHCDWYIQISAGPLKDEVGKVFNCLGLYEKQVNQFRMNSLHGPRLGGLEMF